MQFSRLDVDKDEKGWFVYGVQSVATTGRPVEFVWYLHPCGEWKRTKTGVDSKGCWSVYMNTEAEAKAWVQRYWDAWEEVFIGWAVKKQREEEDVGSIWDEDVPKPSRHRLGRTMGFYFDW